MIRSCLTAGVLACCVSAGAEVRADQDPRIARAQVMFQEGLKEASDHHEAEALKKFKDAYAIYPSANILAAIGRQKQVLGQPLEAIRDLRAASRDPLLNPENAEKVKQQIAELESKLGRLRVDGPRDTRITVDGREYLLPVNDPIDVAPGHYAVTATLAGKTKRSEGEAKAGAIVALKIAFDDAPAHVEPQHDGETKWGTGQTLGVVLAGAGVVALVAGGAFFVAKGSSSDRVASLDRTIAQNRDSCAGAALSAPCQERADKIDERDQRGALGTAFLVGGAVAVAAGVVTFLVWPRTRTSTTGASLRPLTSTSSGGLELRF